MLAKIIIEIVSLINYIQSRENNIDVCFFSDSNHTSSIEITVANTVDRNIILKYNSRHLMYIANNPKYNFSKITMGFSVYSPFDNHIEYNNGNGSLKYMDLPEEFESYLFQLSTVNYENYILEQYKLLSEIRFNDNNFIKFTIWHKSYEEFDNALKILKLYKETL